MAILSKRSEISHDECGVSSLNGHRKFSLSTEAKPSLGAQLMIIAVMQSFHQCKLLCARDKINFHQPVKKRLYSCSIFCAASNCSLECFCESLSRRYSGSFCSLMRQHPENSQTQHPRKKSHFTVYTDSKHGTAPACANSSTQCFRMIDHIFKCQIKTHTFLM